MAIFPSLPEKSIRELPLELKICYQIRSWGPRAKIKSFDDWLKYVSKRECGCRELMKKEFKERKEFLNKYIFSDIRTEAIKRLSWYGYKVEYNSNEDMFVAAGKSYACVFDTKLTNKICHPLEFEAMSMYKIISNDGNDMNERVVYIHSAEILNEGAIQVVCCPVKDDKIDFRDSYTIEYTINADDLRYMNSLKI